MPYKDPEKNKEAKKRYRDQHKEYYRQKSRESEQRHPDKKKARRKVYYESHKDKENQMGVEYRLNKHREYNRVFTESGGEWKCSKCGATREDGATLCTHHKNLDHNDNRPENLVCLCLRCHSSLHGRIRSRVEGELIG